MAGRRRAHHDATGWRAGILSDSGGTPAGGGVLVGGRWVLTCAHVVAAALGIAASGPRPRGQVRLTLEGARPDGFLRAEVEPEGWVPVLEDGGDVAVLALAAAAGAESARIRACGPADGRPVRVYGYPGSAPRGIWAESRVIGRGGENPDWVQLDGIQATGSRIERGFSGAGVWDPAEEAVIGLVVAEYVPANAKVSWMLPMEALAGYWPALKELMKTTVEAERPRRAPPLALSTTELAELADALLAVPFMLDPGERRALLTRLRPAIAAAVPHSPRARPDVLNLIQTCQDYDGGLEELLQAVLATDPESAASRRLVTVLRRLPGGDGGTGEDTDPG